MKIADLDQHCGECNLTEFCGEPFCYCLCTDERFADVDEDVYFAIADTAKGIMKFVHCVDCERPSCGQYRYSELDYEDEDCEYRNEMQDYFCMQIADYVYNELKKEPKK